MALILGLALGSPASAYTSYAYVDVDPVFTRLSAGESVSGTFDIVNPGSDCFFFICDAGGFDPDTQHVVAARVSFLFFDLDLWEPEEISIQLGPEGGPWLQEEEFGGYVFFFHFERFDANGAVTEQLSDTGQLGWTVTASLPTSTALAGSSSWDGHHRHHQGCGHGGNDFYLKVAKLEAAIPEPSAALLFAVGFGVVGTGVRRRRRA